MRTNIIRVMLTLAAVAISSTTTSSELTFAGGRNPSAVNELAGTSWKLVKFQAGDETTLVPADGSKYTIKDGHLFLSGISAGGYYELEPLTTQRRRG